MSVVSWVIKGLRIRNSEGILLQFVIMKVLFIFRCVGKGMKKNIKPQVLSLVSENTNQMVWSFGPQGLGWGRRGDSGHK